VFFGAGIEGEAGGGVVDVIIGAVKEVGRGEVRFIVDGEAGGEAGVPVIVFGIEDGG
jgi:hypothetical protein